MNIQILGLTVRNRRKQLNMTQQQLAQRLHVTDKAVSKWETGKGYPDIQIIPVLAGELGISISDLFGVENSTEELEGILKLDQYDKQTFQRSVLFRLGLAFICIAISGIALAIQYSRSTELFFIIAGLIIAAANIAFVYVFVYQRWRQ